MNFIVTYLLGVEPTKNTGNTIHFKPMDQRMKEQLKIFMESSFKNKKFVPLNNQMPYIFKADWYCGKYEPTQAGRIHLHMLVRFSNFQKI